jgi:hypothetical protein
MAGTQNEEQAPETQESAIPPAIRAVQEPEPSEAEAETDSPADAREDEPADSEAVDPASLSDEEYADWVRDATPEELREFALRKDVSRGTRDYSKKRNELATAEKDFEARVLTFLQGAGPMPAAPGETAPESADDVHYEYTDPALTAALKRIDQLEAKTRQQDLMYGQQALAREIATVAQEHPFFNDMGDKGVLQLLQHMGQIGTTSPKVAFNSLFHEEVVDEVVEKRLRAEREQQARAASVPPTAPRGGAKKVKETVPSDSVAAKNMLARMLKK